MQGGIDALYSRVSTQKVPGAPQGNRQRIERANVNSRRFTPYDGTTENVDLLAGGDPRGRQSGFTPTVLRYNTQPPTGQQNFNQIEALWTGINQVPWGGDPPERQAALAATLPGAAGLSLTPLGNNRVAQPEMTSEVPGEEGISTYAGFGAAPNYFPKFLGDPSYTPEGWGLNATSRPTALQVEMPTPNPGANGDGSNGFFATTREGEASFPGGGAANSPFASINWRRAGAERVEGVVESHVNAPMIYAVMAALDCLGTYGGNPQFDESQHGEILWQAVEDIGVLAQTSDESMNLSPDKLPHSLFNLTSANYWLASLSKDGGDGMPKAPRTWRDVRALLTLHGMIRNDSSARFGPGERFGLSTRVYNCVLNGGEEMVFNEWNARRLQQKVYYIIKRVPHEEIRAHPGAPPGSYALQGSKESSAENIVVVPDDKPRRPFQIVPWKITDQTKITDAPRKKDVAYWDENGIKCYGAAVEVGYVVQIDHPPPSATAVQHATYNVSYRKKLPMVWIAFTGVWLNL